MGAWWQLFWLGSSLAQARARRWKARPRWGECQFNPHVGQANHWCIETTKAIMKRNSRRAKCQKVSPFDGEFKLIEPDAAAVDVGSRSHWVAVNPERDPEAVREFGAFTTDLKSL